MTRMGPARLKMALENHLWRHSDHVNTRQLWEWFASYPYLSRLRDSEVLRRAIENAIHDLANEYFAYADRYDEDAKRYQGVKLGGGGAVVIDAFSVMVKLSVARTQLEAEQAQLSIASGTREVSKVAEPSGTLLTDPQTPEPTKPEPVRRFFATVEVDADRAARDVGRIAEEVLQHLTTLPRSRVKMTVEIEAEAPEGVSADIRRIVTENCQTLRFRAYGFEKNS